MRAYILILVLASTMLPAHGHAKPHTTSSTTATTATTCSPRSIAACPTPFDPCCAYICDEAQVPFAVCQPTNQTVLAVCSQCPSGSALSSSTKTTSTSSHTITTAPTSTSLATSTCSGRLLSTAGCPTPYDPCCAWVCEEAQVPYDVCSQTDGTGEFATCSKCPTPPARL